MEFQLSKLNPLILNVGFAEQNADWNWKKVRSPFARIYYIESGHAAVEIHGVLHQLRQGNLYLIPPYTLHNCICDSHFSHYYIHLYEESTSGGHLLEEWDYPFELQGTEFDRMLMQRLCRQNPNMKLSESNPDSYDNNSTLLMNISHNKSRTISARVESRGIVFMFISRFLETATLKVEVNDNRIEKAMTFIRKNLDTHINIEQLAELTCLSKDHFIRIFKQETGETPIKYITDRKLERAEYLLATDNMPVKNIALSLGYEDHSYFIRLFKKVIGVTPIAYREQNRKKSTCIL